MTNHGESFNNRNFMKQNVENLFSAKLRDELAGKVEDIFSHAAYPETAIGREEVDEFRGDWKTIPLDVLISNRNELSFFTPEGFHYYLPAFLIAALHYPKNVDTLLENLIFHLSPPNPADPWMQIFIKRVSLFTPQQKSIIVYFLELFTKLYPNGEWSFSDETIKKLKDGIRIWSE